MPDGSPAPTYTPKGTDWVVRATGTDPGDGVGLAAVGAGGCRGGAGAVGRAGWTAATRCGAVVGGATLVAGIVANVVEDGGVVAALGTRVVVVEVPT